MSRPSCPQSSPINRINPLSNAGPAMRVATSRGTLGRGAHRHDSRVPWDATCPKNGSSRGGSKTQCGPQNASLVYIAHILQLQRPPARTFSASSTRSGSGRSTRWQGNRHRCRRRQCHLRINGVTACPTDPGGPQILPKRICITRHISCLRSPPVSNPAPADRLSSFRT